MKIGPGGTRSAPGAGQEEATRDVTGEEIRRELDALEVHVQGLGHEAGDESLGQARNVLDEDVAVGEEAGQDLFQHVGLADDHLGQGGEDLLTPIGDRVDLHACLSIRAMRSSRVASDGPRRRIPGRSGGLGRAVLASPHSRGQRIASK